MQHVINLQEIQQEFGAQAEGMVAAIEACVHCGFCLPTCPTYLVQREEMDSPRGRIIIMKSALENSISLSESKNYIERCLGCLSCVTTCPSGVQYDELLLPFKSKLYQKEEKGLIDSILRKFSANVVPYPDRFRRAVHLGNLGRPFAKFVPDDFKKMLEILPERIPDNASLPKFTPAQGERRGRVALLTGCVQQVLEPSINAAAIRVLAANGIDVVIPETQTCCGAIALHNGDKEKAIHFARQNLYAFSGVLNSEFDALITTAAGCGSTLLEYGNLFKAQLEEAAAHMLVEKCKDVSVFLDELGLIPPPPFSVELKIAYHDACHLAHAQKVTSPPRRLLESIPNIRLVTIEQSEICCGSAGTYQFEQPKISEILGKEKSRYIKESGCDLVATGNIGCLVQIQYYLDQADAGYPVYHTIEIIDMAYRGQRPQN